MHAPLHKISHNISLCGRAPGKFRVVSSSCDFQRASRYFGLYSIPHPPPRHLLRLRLCLQVGRPSPPSFICVVLNVTLDCRAPLYISRESSLQNVPGPRSWGQPGFGVRISLYVRPLSLTKTFLPHFSTRLLCLVVRAILT